MDVAESPDRDPRSPEDEEEQQGLSDDDILRESTSEPEPEPDGTRGRASDLEDEDHVAGVPSQGEEENRSDDEDRASEPKSQDQDSEANELSRGPASPPGEGGDEGEDDQTSDLRDEASSVTRELDEHELDYDEEVPEEPAPPGPEDEAEKAGAEEDEEKGHGSPGVQGKAGAAQGAGEREALEAAKEKKKEDDDGEIDDGEIDDDDLEEGEVKDPSDRKVRPRPTCRFFMKDVVTPLPTLPTMPHPAPLRGQVKGNCTWGMNCRFIHPGVNDKGNYSLLTKADPFPPNGAPPLGPHPLMPASPWGGPVVDEILPPPPPEPPTESAWERGLRHAKEVLKKATIRKEQEPDFEEKRFTVTIGEDERELDKENDVFRDWNSRVPRDVRDTALEPYADPYYDYEMERLWRGGQYENFRVQYTEAEPYHSYRERERERERENRQRERERERERDRERGGGGGERRQRERERERERERDKERQRRKEEWERERAKRDEKDRQHRDRERDKERDKEKEKPKPRSPQPPSRQAEPPKKEAASAGPQVKRADEWKDPWRRSKSPKKKLGVSVSPSRARRRRKTSASSASASNSSRSSSRSSSYSGSGSSRSRSRSSSYSSYSSRSSRRSSLSASRSRSRSFSSSPSPSPTPSPHRPVRAKGEPAPLLGKAGEKSVKKPALLPAPPQPTKTPAPAPEPAKPGDPREARRKERQARTPPRRRTRSGSGSGSGSSYSGSSSRSRSLSVSSVSSVSSATSSSSSVRTVDSDDMYADLASPVSSASSRSPTPAQTRKEKGKSKKEDGIKEEKRKRDSSAQQPRSSKLQAGGKSSQQPTPPPQGPPGQPPQGAFVTHKEIKLTLLNKAADKGSRKRYEPSDKDRQSPPAKRAHLSPDRGSRDRKAGGRMGSPKPERQRGQNAKAPVAPADRKRQLSPPAKGSGKVTSVPGKAVEAGAKPGKASTLSRREELLKQLKAVEDAIGFLRDPERPGPEPSHKALGGGPARPPSVLGADSTAALSLHTSGTPGTAAGLSLWVLSETSVGMSRSCQGGRGLERKAPRAHPARRLPPCGPGPQDASRACKARLGPLTTQAGPPAPLGSCQTRIPGRQACMPTLPRTLVKGRGVQERTQLELPASSYHGEPRAIQIPPEPEEAASHKAPRPIRSALREAPGTRTGQRAVGANTSVPPHRARGSQGATEGWALGSTPEASGPAGSNVTAGGRAMGLGGRHHGLWVRRAQRGCGTRSGPQGRED
ncbi:zinc finger CCCH domain-containing protein 18 [Tupaia chinensis]|uniref:zinc finger CCCH domain-containing protein 18 n=1 Tax=Tupaia chinensis TaxID=246437 RepID=UPI00070426E9|nr:zinc finger CCCH domain-containing protein 18 [Tupaia chinensis]